MKRPCIAIAFLALTAAVMAAPPKTLTAGGAATAAADGATPNGAAWRVYAAGAPDAGVTGTVGALAANLWAGELAGLASHPGVGTDCVAVISHELSAGTPAHTGYYAVVNHILSGDDPAVFPEMALRKVPIPAVTSDVLAHLTWNAAGEDTGEAGETNILGYTVYRGSDGITFSPVSPAMVTGTNYDDAIPDDDEYYYAIGLVYRGDPPVTSTVFSANSPRTFKDTDSDTLPDYYELANGLDETSGAGTNGPSGDADGDTMSNWEELIANTLAGDRNSYLFAKEVSPAGSNVIIRWDGRAEREYRLFRSSGNLTGAWSQVYGPVYTPTNAPMEYTDSAGGPLPAFYRLTAQKP